VTVKTLTLESEDSQRYRDARDYTIAALVVLDHWDGIDRVNECRDADELRAYLDDLAPLDDTSDGRWDIYLRARALLGGAS